MTDKMATAEWMPAGEVTENFVYEEGVIWLGRDPESGTPIGHLDNRHILLTSATGGGKGTTFIVPNLLAWPGSLICYDPEGENATVTATRRGRGSEYAVGKDQRVYVLDPFMAADVPEDYRACFNPLDAIDPDSPTLLEETGEVADAIVVHDEHGDNSWNELAKQLIQSLSMHVVTAPEFEGRRNLVTVRELILEGDREGREYIEKIVQEEQRAAAEEGGPAPKKRRIPGSWEVLFRSMANNDRAHGRVAQLGRSWLEQLATTPKYVGSAFGVASRQTMFLSAKTLEPIITRSTFSLDELKEDPDGVSVYLVLKDKHSGEHFRWVRLMLTLFISKLQESQARPESGHNVLFMLDEFAGLERFKKIEDSAAQLRKFHARLFFVVQNLGQLKAIYEDGWETFINNCGTRIFFNIDDLTSRKYVSDLIGEQEVRVVVNQASTARGEALGKTKTSQRGGMTSTTNTSGTQRTAGRNWGTNKQVSNSKTWQESKTDSETIGEAETDVIGASQTDATSWNENEQQGYSVTDQKGRQIGGGSAENSGTGLSKSSGHDANALVFRNRKTLPIFKKNEKLNHGESSHQGIQKSETWGEQESTSIAKTGSKGSGRGGSLANTINSSKSKQASINRGTANTTGVGGGQTVAEGSTEGGMMSEAQSTSVADSQGESWGDSESDSQQLSNTETTGTGENVQARPLLATHELGKEFDEKHGVALVIVGGGAPFKVARTPYYADRHFMCWFDPHPAFDPPLPKVAVCRLELPESDVGFKSGLRLLKQPGEAFEAGEPIAELVGPIAPGLDPEHDPSFVREYELSTNKVGEITLPVSSRYAGTVEAVVDPEDWTGHYTPSSSFVDVAMNRRDFFEGDVTRSLAMRWFAVYVEERREDLARTRYDEEMRRYREARRELSAEVSKLRDVKNSARKVRRKREAAQQKRNELQELRGRAFEKARKAIVASRLDTHHSYLSRREWPSNVAIALIFFGGCAAVTLVSIWIISWPVHPVLAGGLGCAALCVGLSTFFVNLESILDPVMDALVYEPRGKAMARAKRSFDSQIQESQDASVDTYLRLNRSLEFAVPPTMDRIAALNNEINTCDAKLAELGEEQAKAQLCVASTRDQMLLKPVYQPPQRLSS